MWQEDVSMAIEKGKVRWGDMKDKVRVSEGWKEILKKNT